MFSTSSKTWVSSCHSHLPLLYPLVWSTRMYSFLTVRRLRLLNGLLNRSSGIKVSAHHWKNIQVRIGKRPDLYEVESICIFGNPWNFASSRLQKQNKGTRVGGIGNTLTCIHRTRTKLPHPEFSGEYCSAIYARETASPKHQHHPFSTPRIALH